MINLTYEKIIDPVEFIKNFKNEKEFIDWLSLGTVEDIEACLKASIWP